MIAKAPVFNEEDTWTNNSASYYNDYQVSSYPSVGPSLPPHTTTTTTTTSTNQSYLAMVQPRPSPTTIPSNPTPSVPGPGAPRQIVISMPAHTLPPSAIRNNKNATTGPNNNITITATLTPFVGAPPRGKAGADFPSQFASQQSVYGSGATSLKKKRFFRKAAGEIWEDPSLGDWPEDDFRIFCGDLGNEVTDDVLKNAFIKYPSFIKCKVIRDQKTGKTRGYGFVALGDPRDYVKAMQEMNGKYVGNRPIKVRKSNWRERTDLDRNPKKVKKNPSSEKK